MPSLIRRIRKRLSLKAPQEKSMSASTRNFERRPRTRLSVANESGSRIFRKHNKQKSLIEDDVSGIIILSNDEKVVSPVSSLGFDSLNYEVDTNEYETRALNTKISNRSSGNPSLMPSKNIPSIKLKEKIFNVAFRARPDDRPHTDVPLCKTASLSREKLSNAAARARPDDRPHIDLPLCKTVSLSSKSFDSISDRFIPRKKEPIANLQMAFYPDLPGPQKRASCNIEKTSREDPGLQRKSDSDSSETVVEKTNGPKTHQNVSVGMPNLSPVTEKLPPKIQKDAESPNISQISSKKRVESSALAAALPRKTPKREDIVVGKTVVDIVKGNNAGKSGMVVGWMNKATLQVQGDASDNVVNVRLTSVIISAGTLAIPDADKDSPPLWPQEKQGHVKIVAGLNKGKTGVFQTMKTKNTCVVKLDINGTYVCVRLTSIEDVAF
jgi:hypothetical protein